MSSLFMYHTLRIMFDVTDSNSIGSGLCMGSISEHSLQVWRADLSPATYSGSTSSDDMKFVKNELSTMKQLLNMLVGQAGHSAYVADDSNKEPESKKVIFCPKLGTITTLCSIFVIIAHDVVLFVTRENMSKNHGNMLLLSNRPSASSLFRHS